MPSPPPAAPPPIPRPTTPASQLLAEKTKLREILAFISEATGALCSEPKGALDAGLPFRGSFLATENADQWFNLLS